MASIMCTSTMDTIDSSCQLEPYKYINENINKLMFVDDMCDIQTCGKATKEMNKYTASEVSKRKLQFNEDKCKRMHVGKADCVCEEISIDSWEVEKVEVDGKIELIDKPNGKVKTPSVQSQVYLGDIVLANGTYSETVNARVKKGLAVVKNILSILAQIYVGEHYFKALKLLRSSLLISVILHNCEVWNALTAQQIKSIVKLGPNFSPNFN